MTTAPSQPVVSWRAPYPGGWARDYRFGEWLGDPLTPLFETGLLPVLERAFWAALRRVADMPTPRPTYVVVDGWYYASLNFWPPHALGWVARLARHPRLLRVLLQFVPALAEWALAPWVREWRATGLPRHRRVVAEAEARVERLGPDDLLRLVRRVGAAAGDYFVWVALVAGAGYKTEASLARFYRERLAPTLGGSHQALLAGLTDPALALGAHALHSLDWWQPTLGELHAAGPAGGAGRSAGPRHGRPAPAATREAAVAAARAALASDPRRRREFERLLATAQRYAALREEIVAPFTLGWPVLRRAALRLGEGLAGAGLLGARDEVFFLTEGEVVGALRGGAGAGGGGAGLPEAAARRRREWERRRALAPPLRLGQAPRAFQRGLERLEAALAPPAGPAGGPAGPAGEPRAGDRPGAPDPRPGGVRRPAARGGPRGARDRPGLDAPLRPGRRRGHGHGRRPGPHVAGGPGVRDPRRGGHRGRHRPPAERPGGHGGRRRRRGAGAPPGLTAPPGAPRRRPPAACAHRWAPRAGVTTGGAAADDGRSRP